MSTTIGRVHSLQTLGTVDGPGVRFVAFLSGCPLRCSCCHNPDTWDGKNGKTYTAEQLVKTALRYRPYFGADGGITLSGGEPLVQAAFVEAVFKACHEQGIHTCLDTSGVRLDESVKRALLHCDRVLLDIKYTNDADYRQHVGMPYENALSFLAYLNEQHIPTTLRQVVIPTVNDDEENYTVLRRLIAEHPCVDTVELLPFRKLCQTKYDEMQLPFPFAHIPEADAETVAAMQKTL